MRLLPSCDCSTANALCYTWRLLRLCAHAYAALLRPPARSIRGFGLLLDLAVLAKYLLLLLLALLLPVLLAVLPLQLHSLVLVPLLQLLLLLLLVLRCWAACAPDTLIQEGQVQAEGGAGRAAGLMVHACRAVQHGPCCCIAMWCPCRGCQLSECRSCCGGRHGCSR